MKIASQTAFVIPSTARNLLFALAFFFLSLNSASAQVQTGTPPFGSFAGGPDIINLGNLNAHLPIRVLNKAGRGTNFTYDVSYDSAVWYPVTSGGATTWHLLTGWTTASPATMGYATYQTTGPYTCRFFQETQWLTETYYMHDTWIYTDSLGTAHAMIGSIQDGGAPDCGPGDSAVLTTNDGSGYQLTVPQEILYNTSGVVADLNFGAQMGTFKDRNGNQITQGANGVFTDTLGTTALTVTGSGTPSSPIVLTYTPPNTSSSLCSATNTSGVACYVISYVAYTVKSNFGCTGIGEYPATVNNLVDRVTLPDGTYYQFHYESTPVYSGDVTGRVSSIQLPTGGTITYTYTSGGLTGSTVGSTDPIVCADGSNAGLQRAIYDGTNTNTWTYARNQVSGAEWTTTISDPTTPTANQTLIYFQQDSAATYPTKNFYETLRQVYQGSTSGTLLRQWITCYNGNTSSCTTTAVSSPITQRNVTDQYGSSGLQCQHNYFYNTLGGLKEQDDYDYGSGGHGALLRKLLVTYAPLGNNITAFEQTVTICNGSGSSSSCAGPSGGSTGTLVSQTNYNYDEGSVTAPANQPTPQHTTVSGSRGNLTSINYPVSGLTSHSTYYDTGEPNVATDVNGGTTTYTYGSLSATCGNAFPTGITEAISTLTQSYTWNCTGGVMTSLTDENSKATSTTYSDAAFWRPASISYPDTGQTSWAYNSATSLTATTKMSSSQNIVSKVLLDGLGRSKQTQLTSDPEGVDYQDTTYDAVGRVASVSNPYRSTSDPTYGLTSYQYDALSRPTLVIPPDGSSSADNISASYSNNTTTVTDQAGKKLQSAVDALGRLTQVLEDPSGVNYETDYGYDALGNLLCVGQKGTNTGTFSGCSSIPSGWRARTYAWDAMSRLTSEANPETGTINYNYNSSGDLSSKVSPAQNQTGSATVTISYCYDQLHRTTAKAYTYSPANPPTCSGTPPTFPSPAATYLYDASSVDSDPHPFQNPIGRLVKTQQFGLGTYANTYFDYDPVGRIQHVAHCAPAITQNCSYMSTPSWWIVSNTYDLAGNLTSYTDGFNHTLTQSFDSAGRPSQLTSSWVDSTHPATLATVDSSVGYYPPGALRKMNLANGLTQTGALNNALQPCRINWNSTANALGTCSDAIPSGNLQDFNYGFNAGSSDNGNVMNWTATGQQGFTRSFTYDSLNRLHQMTETNGSSEGCKPPSSSSNPYNLTWTYDAWGNRNAQTPSSGTCSFSQSANSNNQLGSPYQYDAAGNMTSDGNLNYFYDAENRLVEVYAGQYLGTQPPSCSSATACYLANALGQRAIKYTNPGNNTYYIHGSDGQIVSYTDTSGNWNLSYLYFGGARLAEYAGTGTYFFHPDHLGSTRFGTDLNRNVTASYDYLPFGEQLTGGNETVIKFAGLERDSETNLDHTLFRQYSSQLGRWMHPDPAGLAAVDPSNPQSWNRYSYVLNNPLSNIDPTGLYCVYLDDSGDGVESIDDNSSSGECGGSGGYWIAGEYGGASQISINGDLGLVSGYGYLDGSWQYSVAGAMDSNTWGAWTQTAGDPGGNSNWSIWDTIRSILPPLSVSGSWLAGPIVPGVLHWGPTVQVTYIPQSNRTCVSGGLAVGTAGKSINAGPLVLGDVQNAEAILKGFSWGGNVQTSPATGAQAISDLSGKLGGPTVANAPGASFSGTYGACFGGNN